MNKPTKEDITALAFKIYKENQSLDESIWRLAHLCVFINKNVINGYDLKPLETDNLVLLIRDDVDGALIEPSEEEIREVAEVIFDEGPSKSELDWYIAEKTLLLNWIKEIIANNKKS